MIVVRRVRACTHLWAAMAQNWTACVHSTHPTLEAKDRHARSLARLFLAPASALLSRRRRRREPHALGPLARHQGLLGHGDAVQEVPEMHATINLVPSLLKQLPAYTDAGHQDTHLRVSRLPADGLSEEDAVLPARTISSWSIRTR